MVEVSVTPHHKIDGSPAPAKSTAAPGWGCSACFGGDGQRRGENASKFALADIQGGMLLSFDAGSWLTTCYVTGFVIGSGFTPCFGRPFRCAGWR